ncbi:hypothetical protein SAMN05443270_2511 [Lacrimispora sphenoides]|jgi:hypothetical protein|nr:hypothetical protein SAMN05443270_2511 [Lacrimispora sphenoides]
MYMLIDKGKCWIINPVREYAFGGKQLVQNGS